MNPGCRLIRWTLKLEEHDYKIVHKAGKSNTNADALSRNPIPDDQHVHISQKDEEWKKKDEHEMPEKVLTDQEFHE